MDKKKEKQLMEALLYMKDNKMQLSEEDKRNFRKIIIESESIAEAYINMANYMKGR